MVNYKKTILSTIIWTLTSLVILSALIICIMFFAFPKNLGDFFYNLGSDGIASSLYMRVYEKEGDIYYCYKSLNIEISKSNNSRIIKLYDTFVNDDDYADFMTQLKERNENISIGVLEKSSILNEEDYLKNRYIKALINQNETNKAYTLAIEEFKGYKSFDFKNQGVYALNQFINIEPYNNFEVTPAGMEGTLIANIKEYFESSLVIFESNKNATTNLEKAYLIALGNRIIQVGQNIIKICDNDTELRTSIDDKLVNVNNCIKEILWTFQKN